MVNTPNYRTRVLWSNIGTLGNGADLRYPCSRVPARANKPGSTPPITATRDRRRRSTRLNTQTAPLNSAEPNSARILIHQPNIITQAAVDAITANVYYNDDTYAWTPRKYIQGKKEENADHDIEHFCAPVVHPDTGETITNYKKLANDPIMSKT